LGDIGHARHYAVVGDSRSPAIERDDERAGREQHRHAGATDASGGARHQGDAAGGID
jgi:hypothetical protein